LAEAIERGEPVEAARFFTAAEQVEIAGAFNRHGFGVLSTVFEALGGKVDYGRLRIFRALLNARAKG
jgi:ATP-dependent DNA helicase RecQ